MSFDPDIHARRSVRLKGYDYAQSGAYFFTIVVKGRGCLFGNIVNGEMILNDLSMIVRDEWNNSFELRSRFEPDQSVIMPNHFHGIVWITQARSRGTARRAPTAEQFGNPVSGSLPTFIRAFKSATTRRINQLRNTQGTQLWQRNYYERVIRNENELSKLREYTLNNPRKWEIDRENPKVPWVKRQAVNRVDRGEYEHAGTEFS